MAVLWIVLSLLALFVLYLLLIRPGRRHPALARLPRIPYAHRGLWNAQLPENSLPAFQHAAAQGFGVELDVHLTGDGRLAVIHDDTLDRMCPGAPHGLRISDAAMETLQAYPLRDTACTVPELRDVLAVLAGRSPMIIELKTGPHREQLVRRVIDELSAFPQAVYCIESFDPRIVRLWKRLGPADVPAGQLAFGARGLDRTAPRTPFLPMLRSLACNAVSRPHFIAWGQHTRSLAFDLVRRVYHPFTMAWTVHSQAQMDTLDTLYDVQIFEGFLPKR